MTPEDTDASPHRRRRRRAIAVGAVIVVVAAVGVGIVVWHRDDTRAVTLDEAARRLHGSTTVTAAPAIYRPAVGVYRYTGSGTDHISTPPKDQAEGPEMPATVTDDGDGCWRFRIDYSTNHWQSWRYCPVPGGLDEAGGQTHQRWDFVVFANDSTSTFVCDGAPTIRAAQQEGSTLPQRCHDRDDPSTVSAGTVRFEGAETLRIGGRDVPRAALPAAPNDVRGTARHRAFRGLVRRGHRVAPPQPAHHRGRHLDRDRRRPLQRTRLVRTGIAPARRLRLARGRAQACRFRSAGPHRVTADHAEHVVEALDEALEHDVWVRHGRTVGDDADARRVDVGEQRDVDGSARRWSERVLPEELRAGEVAHATECPARS